MMIMFIMVMGMKVMRMMVTLMIKSEMTLDSFPNPCDVPEVGWLGVRLFARRTFTTPKIRTFTTPKFGHFPPPKKKHLPGGQLPPPIFFLLFLAHFSWLFRLTAHGGHQDGKEEVLDEVVMEHIK